MTVGSAAAVPTEQYFVPTFEGIAKYRPRSLNLSKFFNVEGEFDLDAFRHAVRLWTVALEISVLMASFPSRQIAQKSYEFRSLGLDYANLGTILMKQSIPYDSPKAVAICGAITAIMTA